MLILFSSKFGVGNSDFGTGVNSLKFTDTAVFGLYKKKIFDEVHTITSLSGLEALIRNKKVFTYGMPFYSGWGLTEDFRKCDRRKRKLNLTQLVAATYILYPEYRSIKTLKKSSPEEILEEIKEMKIKYFNDIFFRFKINFMAKSAVILRKIRDLL